MSEMKFPTEVIELPSKGLLYPKTSPLSSGKVEIKYMTAKEEDILTSPNLIQQGIALDVLLQSLIVDKSINLDDMIVGDKNAVLVGARILGYGKNYECTIGDEEAVIDLTSLKEKWLDSKILAKQNENEVNYTLPLSKIKITFKFIDGHMEKDIDTLNQSYEKIGESRVLTNRYKVQITSVNGNRDEKEIHNFIDNAFMAGDSRAFREYVSEVEPDLDFVTQAQMESGEMKEVTVPMTVQFFWPSVKI